MLIVFKNRISLNLSNAPEQGSFRKFTFSIYWKDNNSVSSAILICFAITSYLFLNIESKIDLVTALGSLFTLSSL